MSTRIVGLILLVMTLLMVISLLGGCTTIPGHGTTTIRVSDDCRSGADPADPAWWPACPLRGDR